MRPYGFKPLQFRDEDGGPTSKHAKLSSKARTAARRSIHKAGRRDGRTAIKDSIVSNLFRPGANTR